jgi:hypothetical protein
MSVTAQAGLFGFGIQANGEKGQPVGTWYRHKALFAGYGPDVQKEVAPPEISGINNPTGAYKTGAGFGGRVSLQPRLEGDFGWLLLGAAGNCSSVANATTGFTHTFTQKPGNAIFIPFMGFRRVIPGRDTTKDLGETGKDCIIPTMVINYPQVGPLSTDLQILGREFLFDNAPDLFAWADVTENYDSVPMVMKGSGLLLPNWVFGGGVPLPATNARVTLNNNTSTPQEERVIGSYFPEDFTTRQRSLTIEFTYKWDNPDLYRFIINGGDPATLDFRPCCEYTDLQLEVESPCDISDAVPFPWTFRIEAPKVDWRYDPIQLSGDELLMMNVTGVAVEADSTLAEDYFKFILSNAQASYPMPVA